MSQALIGKDVRSAVDARGDVLSTSGTRLAGKKKSLLMLIVRLVWTSALVAVWVVLAPFRLLRAIRQNMTAASVSVLLVGITTLNIVWGYPWTGMFAACISLLSIGMLVNFCLRPRLRIDFSLPSFTPAGQPCKIVVHGINTRRFPAFDFSVGLGAVHQAGSRRRNRNNRPLTETSPPLSVAVLRPGDRIDVASSVVFHRRGIHPVPDVVLATTFPFHLFCSTQVVPSAATIAVTPSPLTGDEDAAARALLQAVGGWSHRLLSGDALDYTGSREYQPGMPVRRWDFSSWARLGKPIVREFQSPSIQSVLLLVDTAVSCEHPKDEALRLVERALSLAASAINDLLGKSIRVQLYVTSESPAEQLAESIVHGSTNDAESMQIRLARAESSPAAEADQHLRDFLHEVAGAPTLLITSRRNMDVIDHLSGNINVICIDQAESSQIADVVTESSSGSGPARLDPAHDAGRRNPADKNQHAVFASGSRYED